MCYHESVFFRFFQYRYKINQVHNYILLGKSKTVFKNATYSVLTINIQYYIHHSIQKQNTYLETQTNPPCTTVHSFRWKPSFDNWHHLAVSVFKIFGACWLVGILILVHSSFLKNPTTPGLSFSSTIHHKIIPGNLSSFSNFFSPFWRPVV